MKVADYIVELLVENGITDIFGYPGGMVTYFMDSLHRHSSDITSHISYNEQGAAMAACGYAVASKKMGVAFATSGPGATNLITGICNAYMDSIPTLFITGQVNLNEQRGELQVRQRGFQEADIVAMTESCTKYSTRVESAQDLVEKIHKAIYIARSNRKGPVLLDIPMNVFKEEIDEVEPITSFTESRIEDRADIYSDDVASIVRASKRPVILLGRGLSDTDEIIAETNKLGIPIVSSMISIDVASRFSNYFGFIGAYGDRTANFIVAKCDLLISIGARLDVRQVGSRREQFAPNAKIIRVDIDNAELTYRVHEDEYQIRDDASVAFRKIVNTISKINYKYDNWISVCYSIKSKLTTCNSGKQVGNSLIAQISNHIPKTSIITTDVGQNQIWVAQSFVIKEDQQILFSGGFGAMGFSLPAAIGACIAKGKKRTYAFSGDGGIQMNIQELQMISSERLPIKIVIMNNHALGMIRHFQEMYFDETYTMTTEESGYGTPDFSKIAEAYGLKYVQITKMEDVDNNTSLLLTDEPIIVDVFLPSETRAYPKLEFGKPNQDQEPLIDRMLYDEIMSL